MVHISVVDFCNAEIKDNRMYIKKQNTIYSTVDRMSKSNIKTYLRKFNKLYSDNPITELEYVEIMTNLFSKQNINYLKNNYDVSTFFIDELLNGKKNTQYIECGIKKVRGIEQEYNCIKQIIKSKNINTGKRGSICRLKIKCGVWVNGIIDFINEEYVFEVKYIQNNIKEPDLSHYILQASIYSVCTKKDAMLILGHNEKIYKEIEIKYKDAYELVTNYYKDKDIQVEEEDYGNKYNQYGFIECLKDNICCE